MLRVAEKVPLPAELPRAATKVRLEAALPHPDAARQPTSHPLAAPLRVARQAAVHPAAHWVRMVHREAVARLRAVPAVDHRAAVPPAVVPPAADRRVRSHKVLIAVAGVAFIFTSFDFSKEGGPTKDLPPWPSVDLCSEIIFPIGLRIQQLAGIAF